MLLRYNVEKINSVIKDFHIATGISVSVLDANGEMIAQHLSKTHSICKLVQASKEGKQRCLASDNALVEEAREKRTSVTRICHAGLADTVVPIYNSARLLGFIMFGQVGDGLTKFPFEDLRTKLGGLGIDEAELEKAYNECEFVEEKKIVSATNLAVILTKYILLEHMIVSTSGDEFDGIIKYINENIADKMTVQSVCRRFLISKNTLYDLFRENLNCSVKDYLSQRRIEYSAELLKNTDLSVSEINEKCGIDNYTYFCRIFKERMGDTPLQYRKKWRQAQASKRTK